MDEVTKKKQNYLRKEIMDQNYDPELFSEFLVSKKGDDALDLELWTFRELQEAVIEFKSKLDEYAKSQSKKEKEEEKEKEKERNYHNQDTYQNYDQQSQEQNNSNVNEQSHAQLSRQGTKEHNMSRDNHDQSITIDIDYNDTVPAKKLTKSVFEQYEDITVTISDVEKNQGSIFTKAFVTYRINTEQVKLSVVRRYSDFKSLQELLQSIFVGICIPPLPGKKYNDRFFDSFVNKRKRYLEKFLQALMTIPIIRNSPMLFDFLSITDEVEFKKSLLKYNDLIKPSFNNYLSHDGLLDLKISKETEAQIELLKANNAQNEILLTKLSMLSKSLYQEIQQVSNRMIEMSDVFQQLRECSNNCKDNEMITELYAIMSQVMKKWSECEKRKSNVIETHIREHYKYIKNEFALMKDLFDKADASHKNLNKLFRQITSKKEDLFKKGEVKNWELNEEDMKNAPELLQNKKLALSKMIPKKSEELNIAKKEYGYYAVCVLSEMKRLRKINGIRTKDNCTYLSNANNEMINSLYKMWADAIMSIASVEY